MNTTGDILDNIVCWDRFEDMVGRSQKCQLMEGEMEGWLMIGLGRSCMVGNEGRREGEKGEGRFSNGVGEGVGRGGCGREGKGVGGCCQENNGIVDIVHLYGLGVGTMAFTSDEE